MRYRVRLWHLSVFHMVRDCKPEIIATKYFRWRWTAFLYEFPYLFGPSFPGSIFWTERDMVFVIKVNGKRQYVEMDKHSTQMTVRV